MKSRQSIWLMVMLVFIIPAVAYTAVNWYDKKFGSLPYFGPVVKTAEGKEQHRIREFSLVNQDNKNITLSGLGNNIIIADFFFTHCPVICPKMTNGLRTVQEAFKDDHKILSCHIINGLFLARQQVPVAIINVQLPAILF